MRAYMRSTFDRAGGNEGADASRFLYRLANGLNRPLCPGYAVAEEGWSEIKYTEYSSVTPQIR